MGEKDAARVLLRDTTVMEDLRERQVERYLRLEELLNRTGPLEEHELYASTSGSRAQRRAMIAEQLSKDLSMVPASRLLTLLGMSVKWMERQGQLPADASAFDLFRGMSTATVDEGEDLAPGECFATMKVSDEWGEGNGAIMRKLTRMSSLVWCQIVRGGSAVHAKR